MPDSLPMIVEKEECEAVDEDASHTKRNYDRPNDDSEMDFDMYSEFSSQEDSVSSSSNRNTFDSSVSDSVSDDEGDESGVVFDSEGKKKALELLHCFKRHDLTASASKDILRTLKTVLPSTDSETQSIFSYKQLLSYIPACNSKEIYYCLECEHTLDCDRYQSHCNKQNCRGKLKSFMIADVKELCNWFKTQGQYNSLCLGKPLR